MLLNNNRGYSLLEVIIAGLVLTVVLIPLVNMQVKINSLAISAEKYNTALYLAMGRLEEIKGIPYEQMQELPQSGVRTVFVGYSAYNYQIAVEKGEYGLKTVTVEVFYQELGREKSVRLTTERRK